MADVENQTASSVTTGSAATPQSHAKKEKKAKNPRAKPSHPPTSEMVNNAIKGLKERGGSSLQAIKKFVAANYKVDAEKVAPFIKKYLKGAVASGSLVQTKGKGASGSFKLASSTSGGAKVASASDKRKPASSAASKTKKSSAKRTAVATTSDKASSKTAKKQASPQTQDSQSHSCQGEKSRFAEEEKVRNVDGYSTTRSSSCSFGCASFRRHHRTTGNGARTNGPFQGHTIIYDEKKK
jgi:histone H1/5